MLEKIKAPILWVSGYYDGPLSGACLVDNEIAWFSMIEDAEVIGWETITEDGEEFREAIWSPRRWGIYKLTDEEFRGLVTMHFLFEHYVGTHHCNHAPGSVKDRSTHATFYVIDQPYGQFPTEDREPFAELERG